MKFGPKIGQRYI